MPETHSHYEDADTPQAGTTSAQEALDSEELLTSLDGKTGSFFLRVWLVDRTFSYRDAVAGMPPYEGDYMWVHESHVGAFVDALKRDHPEREGDIVAEGRTFHECESIPSLQEELEQFAAYRNRPIDFSHVFRQAGVLD